MALDTDGELLDARASGKALVRILYRDIVTVLVLSLAWTLGSVPVVTLGPATLALCETMTRVVTDRSEDRLVNERDRLRAFGAAFRRYVLRGVPLSALLVALFLSVWFHGRIYTVSGEWLFSVSTLVGLYFLVVGIAWTMRAASLLVRAPSGNQPGLARAFLDGAELALEHPHYTVLQLLTVGAALVLASLQPVALLVLLPGTVAVVEVVAFEEIVNNAAADIRQYYADVA
jgi:uncharacterized membrane protein YesL